MNIPSRVNICGKEFKVVKDPKYSGGSFRESEQRITVGTQYGWNVDEVFLHEVIEVIMAIRNLRYRLENNSGENGDLLFSFTHREFVNVIKDIAYALKGVNFNGKN